MSTTHVCTEAYSKNGISIVSRVTWKVFILRVRVLVPEPRPENGRMPCLCWPTKLQVSLTKWIKCSRTLASLAASLRKSQQLLQVILPTADLCIMAFGKPSNNGRQQVKAVCFGVPPQHFETCYEHIWLCDECQQPLSASSKRLLFRKRDRHINEVHAASRQIPHYWDSSSVAWYSVQTRRLGVC